MSYLLDSEGLPAAASYGFYKNFEERGRHFKELVNKL